MDKIALVSPHRCLILYVKSHTDGGSYVHFSNNVLVTDVDSAKYIVNHFNGVLTLADHIKLNANIIAKAREAALQKDTKLISSIELATEDNEENEDTEDTEDTEDDEDNEDNEENEENEDNDVKVNEQEGEVEVKQDYETKDEPEE